LALTGQRRRPFVAAPATAGDRLAREAGFLVDEAGFLADEAAFLVREAGFLVREAVARCEAGISALATAFVKRGICFSR
jgi:hypothetical protein